MNCLAITVDAGDWERAKAAVKQRNGLFGNPQATYDPTSARSTNSTTSLAQSPAATCSP